MEKKTKTILKVLAAVAIVAISYNMLSKKEETTSGFLGFSFGKKKKKKTSSGTSNKQEGGDTPKCVTTCEYTNKFNGQVSVYANSCNSAKANQGWKTITRCSGGGTNDVLSNNI